jgi:mannose-6-phosphate isomerase-like protein (cupin superfamily)
VTADEAFSADLAGRLVAAPDAHIVIAQWADPGGGGDPPRYIAPLHVHHADDEAWYVLDGALVVRSGDRDLEVPAGGAAIVPRGTPHTYWNPQPGRLAVRLSRRRPAGCGAPPGRAAARPA